MAISNATVVPTVIAGAFLRQFQKARVHTARVDNTWRSALRNGGDSVVINQDLEGDIGDYRTSAGGSSSDITYTSADVGPAITLSLSKWKRWAVTFDDIDAARSSLAVLESSVRRHAEALALVVDTDVKDVMVAGATATSAFTLDHDASTLSVDALSLPRLHRVLDLNRVPRDGRWIIVGPYTAEFIQRVALKTERLTVAQTTQDLVNGRLGSFGGFTWYVDRTAQDTSLRFTSGKGDATETWLIGVDSATAFIEQVRRTERLRLQTRFADAVRGLYTYGMQVLDFDFRNLASQNTANALPRLLKATVSIDNVPQ